MSERIVVEALVNAPVERAWEAYTDSAHIMQWNHASEDWHCPSATNDARTGGAFSFRMEAKDGSAGFDFAGTYDEVVPQKKISYTFGGRKAEVAFAPEGEATRVTVHFDPEDENPIEMQRAGWMAILENFRRYSEAL